MSPVVMVKARFRVHLIFTADGFDAPVSFRTDVWADDMSGAYLAARGWLDEQPLTGIELLSVLSVEKVPSRQP